jgi:5-methylcytosine-specific restriction endonuclease McrA
MVGEIRDVETADIAIEAALTGHLVLSTLHTNDAPSATLRLIDMGVEPFLIAATLIGVLAQRLGRRIDPDSRESYEIPAGDLRRFGLVTETPDELITLYRGIPAEPNRMTGYRGRTGFHELMTINQEIAEMIVRRAPLGDIKAAAKANGMHELREDGLVKVLGGVTDPFLYERESSAIVLKPGVAYCLRRFQPLIQQLARSNWIDHIKRNKQNIALLGQDNDLEAFLFETSRQSLVIVQIGLRKISSKCFYCGSSVTDADVDHFIPHSLYPRDLAHNFVLAHPSCNRSKSDTLAAKVHLHHWLEFVQSNADNLSQIGEDAGIMADEGSMDSVAQWGYANAVAGGGQGWVKPNQYEPIDDSYLKSWV